MSSFGSDSSLPEGFAGVVKLFPLPNLVLFPGVIQALHIFEPRYRKMATDALNSDHLISMALAKGGEEVDLDLSPQLHPIVCIGKIITHNELEDGRFNLLLMGLQRARIIEEISGDEPYRVAKVEVLTETCQTTPEEVIRARKHLIEIFRERAKSSGNLDEELVANLANPELPFGMLVDLVCFSSGASTVFMQEMLSTLDVWERSQMLIGEMTHQSENPSANPGFPPDFSLN